MLQPSAELILASRSPRRADLLRQIGVGFLQQAADIDETVRPQEQPLDYVERLALEKAAAVWKAQDQALPVLGSDTSVIIENDILGKPESREHFLEMLGRLSGNVHEVCTAVAIVTEQNAQSLISRSHVRFRDIGKAEMLRYWESGEPADKAGGYAIQGFAAVFVREIQGSYSGVMGLPLFETAALLERCGMSVRPPRKA